MRSNGKGLTVGEGDFGKQPEIYKNLGFREAGEISILIIQNVRLHLLQAITGNCS